MGLFRIEFERGLVAVLLPRAAQDKSCHGTGRNRRSGSIRRRVWRRHVIPVDDTVHAVGQDSPGRQGDVSVSPAIVVAVAVPDVGIRTTGAVVRLLARRSDTAAFCQDSCSVLRMGCY